MLQVWSDCRHLVWIGNHVRGEGLSSIRLHRETIQLKKFDSKSHLKNHLSFDLRFPKLQKSSIMGCLEMAQNPNEISSGFLSQNYFNWIVPPDSFGLAMAHEGDPLEVTRDGVTFELLPNSDYPNPAVSNFDSGCMVILDDESLFLGTIHKSSPQKFQLFWSPSPLSAFGTDLQHEIHATSPCTSAF